MGRAGFSLIELLVVIFIIGVLVAILVPTLARSRASADDLLCQTHLRAVIQADFEYAQDNDGLLAPRGFDPFNPSSLSPTNPASWQAHLAPYLGLEGLLQHIDRPVSGSNARPLHYEDVRLPTGYAARLVWSCPLRGAIENWSYALNEYMGPFRNEVGIPPSPWGYKLSAVVGPSSIIVLGDSALNGSDFGGDQVGPADRLTPGNNGPGFRHGTQGEDAAGHPRGVANFAFADGHVEPLRYSETLEAAAHWKWW